MLSTSDDEDMVEGSGSHEISDNPRSNTVSSMTTPNINILAYFRGTLYVILSGLVG
jgi:hypothetical protein